jgi:hypothetical protein
VRSTVLLNGPLLVIHFFPSSLLAPALSENRKFISLNYEYRIMQRVKKDVTDFNGALCALLGYAAGHELGYSNIAIPIGGTVYFYCMTDVLLRARSGRGISERIYDGFQKAGKYFC